MRSVLIDSPGSLTAFLDCISKYTGQPAALYVDLEGNNLSRHGTLSLITVLVQPEEVVYLVDITTLGRDAFTTKGSNEQSLKDVFEANDVVKVFFDIRNDSDALFALYDVRVDGIEDLQLMELASRYGVKQHVNGLAKCIEQDSALDHTQRRDWQRIKDRGRTLFAPERGGTYDVFDQRPLSPELLEYCAQDVVHMPRLRRVYRAKLCDAAWIRIVACTKDRIQLSQTPGFNGKGRHMALAPAELAHWTPSMDERGHRELLKEEVPPEIVSSVSTADNPIGRALAESIQSTSPFSADHDTDSEVEYGFGHGYRNSDEEEDDAFRDLTACDKECGYCGRCMY